MAVRMRLRREGKRKQPYYRVVIADIRSPRDGRFVEDLGYYHPLREPSDISIDRERALHWLRSGAQPSQAVVNLLRIEGIWQEFKPDDGDPHAQRRERRAAKRDAKRAAQQRAGRAEADAQQQLEEDKAAADAEEAEAVTEQAREEVAQPPEDQPTGAGADEVSDPSGAEQPAADPQADATDATADADEAEEKTE